jgi:preprotein translocase subunit SecG
MTARENIFSFSGGNMVSTLAVLHIIVCVLLILLIMIQDPKGGGSGIFSGGGSNSILGSSGGADFLTKVTRYVAIAFGALCIGLTMTSKPSKSGVFSDTPATALEQPKEALDTAKPAPADAAPAKPADANPAAEKK